MTDTDAPRSHSVELTGSFAQRIDGQVRLVLQLEGPLDRQPGAAPLSLRLTAGSRTIEAPVAVSERDGEAVVECRVEASSLRGATWRLELVDETGSGRVEARLVVRARQPVALLPGPEPTTVLAPPKPPRKQRTDAPARGRVSSRSRVRGALAGPARSALGLLPADRAERYRKVLREVAARLDL